MHVLTRDEMREADAAAVKLLPGGETALMTAAGAALADVCRAYAPPGAYVVCFAGRGNNGGDGALALAELAADRRCALYLTHAVEELSASARSAVERAAEHGVAVYPMPREPLEALRGADLAVEALVGTGAHLPLDERLAQCVAALGVAPVPVVACDVPAGVDPTTGEVASVALRAAATLALGAMKSGLLIEPGRSHAGELWIAEIGFPERLLDTYERTYRACEFESFARELPKREERVDKYAAGHVVIIAGSEEYPGAAVLCTRAAARAGAGYVTLFTPREAVASVRAHVVEQVVRPLPIDPDPLLRALHGASAVAIGPGLGREPTTQELVRMVVQSVDRPMVIDADGLFALSGRVEMLAGCTAVITPHAGEFARLVGRERADVERDCVDAACTFAREHPEGPVLLLKGSPTVIIADHTGIHLGWAGTSALATAGTGDVLTGTIAALLARGLAPLEAARVGAFWHAMAGRVAESWHTGGVIAGDVCEALPAVVSLARGEPGIARWPSARRVLPRL